MIKKTLYFGNPVYLSLKNAQLMIKLPEVVRNDTLPESFKRCFQWLKVTKMKANHNCNRIEPKRREAVSNGPKLLK